jgi:hypothetical protein
MVMLRSVGGGSAADLDTRALTTEDDLVDLDGLSSAHDSERSPATEGLLSQTADPERSEAHAAALGDDRKDELGRPGAQSARRPALVTARLPRRARAIARREGSANRRRSRAVALRQSLRPSRAAAVVALALTLAAGATAAISYLGSTGSPARPHIEAASITGDAPQRARQVSELRASSRQLARVQHATRTPRRQARRVSRRHGHHAGAPTKRTSRTPRTANAHVPNSHGTTGSTSLSAEGTRSYSSHTSTPVSSAEQTRTESAPASTQTATQPPGPSGPGGAVGSNCNPKCS